LTSKIVLWVFSMSMRPYKGNKASPEAGIRARIIKHLEERGWFVKITHGGMFQSGFPDLFAAHAEFGMRWIEIKNPDRYKFTRAQLRDFPEFESHGAGIWVLTGVSESWKLFHPANWREYL